MQGEPCCSLSEFKPLTCLVSVTEEAAASPGVKLTDELQSPPAEGCTRDSTLEELRQKSDESLLEGCEKRDLEQQINVISGEKSNLEATVQQLREEQEKLCVELGELKVQQQKWWDSEKQFNNMADEKRCIEGTVQQLTADLAALHEELGSLRLSLQEANFCETAYQDILRDKSELEDKISLLTSELQCSTQNVIELTEENRKSNDRVVELLSVVTKWELENDRLTRELSEAKQELMDYKQQFDELQREKTLVREAAQKAECDRRLEVSHLSECIAQLEGEVREKNEKCSDLESQKVTLKEECERIFAEFEKQQVDFGRLNDKVIELEAQIRAFDAVTTEKEQLKVINERLQKEKVETETKWCEVVSEKQLTISGLKDDLEALSGSVQRRERMWESARERMEQEILSLQTAIDQKSAEYKSKLEVNVYNNLFLDVHSFVFQRTL
jgi:chromosome segregation ATPase